MNKNLYIIIIQGSRGAAVGAAEDCDAAEAESEAREERQDPAPG